MRLVLAAALSLVLASPVLADAKLSQKTRVQLTGVLGTAMNVFGGRAAREGVTSDIAVKGNRRISRSGESAEIVDLDEEKIYSVDYARKTYKVTTFDEVRKQFKDAMSERDEEESESKKDNKKDPDAKEYEIDFASKSTGQRETINGFEAKQTIATITIREKGKKLQESGGAVLTADMWMTPRVAALREYEEFERRYVKKLWGDLGVDMRSMAALTAAAPEFSKAMKALRENQAKLEGTSVRSIVTFEAVPDPRQPETASEEEEEGASAANQAVKALGGFMNRMKKKPAEEPAEDSKPVAAKTKNGKVLFTSSSEVLSASATATSGDVAIPAGFSQKR
jgi:hypothetical protein